MLRNLMKPSQDTNPYDDTFFADISPDSLRSAEVIVPLVLDLIPATSVVDVGCGRGAWLSTFQEHGVAKLTGVDGAYVEPQRLLATKARFVVTDLRQALPMLDCHDLALCLEVVEHIPMRAARRVVRTLTRIAPAVLFSAALPGQGGTSHVNEQWHDVWHEEFHRHGYTVVDAIRSRIQYNEQVCWWYRQNIFLYIRHDVLMDNAKLQEVQAAGERVELILVSRRVLSELRRPRILLRELLATTCRSLLRRAGGYWLRVMSDG